MFSCKFLSLSRWPSYELAKIWKNKLGKNQWKINIVIDFWTFEHIVCLMPSIRGPIFNSNESKLHPPELREEGQLKKPGQLTNYYKYSPFMNRAEKSRTRSVAWSKEVMPAHNILDSLFLNLKKRNEVHLTMFLNF